MEIEFSVTSIDSPNSPHFSHFELALFMVRT